MAKSDRAKAVEVIAEAFSNSDGRWRNWGALTLARVAYKALLAADFEVKPRVHNNGGGA